MKFVLDHEVFWDHGHLDPCVIISGHWVVYVRVFFVHTRVFGSLSGDHCVEVIFDGCEVSCWVGSEDWVINVLLPTINCT